MKTIQHAWQCNRFWLLCVASLPMLTFALMWFAMERMFSPVDYSDPWLFSVPALVLFCSGASLFCYHYFLQGRPDHMKNVVNVVYGVMFLGVLIALFTK